MDEIKMDDQYNLQPKDMSTTQSRVQLDKSNPSVTSCMSLKSDRSMDPPISMQDKALLSGHEYIPEGPSCASLRSDFSMDPPITMKDKNLPSGHEYTPQAPSCVSLRSDFSMDPPITMKDKTPPSGHESIPLALSSVSFKSDYPLEPQKDNVPPSGHESSLTEDESYKKFKSKLKNRFQCLSDELQHHGHSTLLNDIYTELYITEGGRGEVNNEHEVRQIEMAARTHSSAEDIPIKCNDIFKPLPGQEKQIRTVLTKGVAGIGKTVSVQKFIVDWAEGEANQDVHFIFPLPFRELNLMSSLSFSLEGLVHHFFPELREVKIAHVAFHNIVFIFDGLDEHRSSQAFHKTEIISDITKMATVNTLLINLIKGNLLPLAKIWITSRPAAADQIPIDCVSQVTEIRGFNDPQKEEYFKKRISDLSLANRTIAHLKSSRSLYIMCHIPVFCWISATVLEKMLGDAEGAKIPKTLTQMYTHFLIIQACNRKEKYAESEQIDKEMILKLGRLAFKQLIKGNLIFYEEDLTECEIDVKDAVLYSGVCTQIFREESKLFEGKGKVFCFIHLSIQEHLAALYVYISFSEGKRMVLSQWNPVHIAATFPCSSMSDLHQSAVDKALRSTNGQFDLFLRFFLGLSQENNQSLLQMLLPQISYDSHNVEKTIDYIKIRLRMNLSPEKYINLFHCLNELNDSSLQDEILTLLSSGRLSKTKLSPAQWSALVFVLLTSEREVDVFDMRKYSLSNADECLYRMLPVVKAARTAEVRHCNISDKGFQALTSALNSKSSTLRELKLSGNAMHGTGMQILSQGFKSQHCKLETLEELDLSFNLFGDYGMKMFSDVLRNRMCRLEKLKLCNCELTSKGCMSLSEALKSNTSLTELDLSKNSLQDSGVKMLSAVLKNPQFKLRSLSLADCGLTESSCVSLSVALKSNSSHFSDLCLNFNTLRDSGVKTIAEFLKWPQCSMEKLSLSHCNITEEGCFYLTSALESNPSHLRVLELTGNKPGKSGRDQLKALQEHKDFRLEKLKL
ncbi:NLR family CARD domain-containing protein 3-like isoform X2 [Hoplias malabaricus]|uniref:NLR family CARD domain-containing protein 3-like isoform X2 n=1 Tax=Hoplias malabaricus TaxID=27720 RepID=UPI0034628A22